MTSRGRMRRAIRARKYITSQNLVPHQIPMDISKKVENVSETILHKIDPKQDARDSMIRSIQLKIAKMGNERGIAVVVEALNFQMFISSMDEKEKYHAMQ